MHKDEYLTSLGGLKKANLSVLPDKKQQQLRKNMQNAEDVFERVNEIKKAKDYIYKIYKNYDVTKLIKKKFNKIKVKNSNSLIYKLLNNED